MFSLLISHFCLTCCAAIICGAFIHIRERPFLRGGEEDIWQEIETEKTIDFERDRFDEWRARVGHAWIWEIFEDKWTFGQPAATIRQWYGRIPPLSSRANPPTLTSTPPWHPVYFWPKLTSRLVEGSHQVAIFQIVLVVAIKRSQGDPGSAKSMQTDILTHWFLWEASY